ncbi:MAG: helix-turn-helix domain-containing protein [Gemmatimonadales bacterium]|nr:helix-turn-helix domain-containing protein [Gemmatimonadales bacterium]
MKFIDGISDEATLKELGNRIAQYRLNRNLTQGALAHEAGVSKRTLHRIEHGDSTNVTNTLRILRALDLLGNLETLIPEPASSPIQQVKMQGKKRKRASSPASNQGPKGPWSWGGKE